MSPAPRTPAAGGAAVYPLWLRLLFVCSLGAIVIGFVSAILSATWLMRWVAPEAPFVIASAGILGLMVVDDIGGQILAEHERAAGIPVREIAP